MRLQPSKRGRHTPSTTIFFLFDDLKNTDSGSEKKRLLKELIYKLSYIPSGMLKDFRWADNHDDLLQIGYEVLYRCILSFDNTKSNSFFLYSNRWIRKELAKERKREWQWHKVSKESVQVSDVVDELEDPSDLETSVINDEDRIILKKALSRLDPTSRKVLICTYGLDGTEEKSLRELGDELGISYESVRRIRDSAILTIRSHMKQNEITTNINSLKR